jgi:heat shock protein HtpX
MARTRFPSDPGLTSRMGLTIFLLGLLYVVFIGVLLSLRVSSAVVIVIAAGVLIAQWAFSDKIAMAAMRAREVSPQQAPELHAIVDRLCALADMPKPRVAIADTDLPNAFATGRSPRRAVVCATTGIMRRLSPPELEAVLAHELSHVANRDVTVMTVASFLGVLAGFVVRFAAWGGMGSDRRDNRDSGGVPIVLIILMVSAVVYAVSFLLTRALSRYRELSADRGAAVLTGRPSLLSSALVKISGDMVRIPSRDLRRAEPVSALLFVPALARKASLTALFATHPPLERRLDQLARIEAQMGRPGA